MFMTNVEYDKLNNGVAFRESDHCYFKIDDPTQRFISVTTLIGKFENEFDKEFFSAYKALEKLISHEEFMSEKSRLLKFKRFDWNILDVYNIDRDVFLKAQQDVLDEWAKTNKEACEYGTKKHLELENSFYDKGKNIELNKFGIGGKFVCKKDYTDLDLEHGVYPEYLIHYETSDGILKLAGQVDLIVKDGNDIVIIDHKTNANFKTKSYFNNTTKQSVKMKYPLNNLDDCHLYHYTMQLSTYAWMLQRINPDFVIKDLILNHYDREGNNTLYHCDYLKTEVEHMLCFYKKELIKEQQRQKRKSIDY